MIEVDGENYKLNINDIFGYDRMNAWIADLTKRCDGFIIVFSLTKLDSFDSIPKMINMIQSIKKKKACDLPLVILGNKEDNESIRVNDHQLQELSRRFNVDVIKVSALTGNNVNMVFEKLVEKYIICRAKEQQKKQMNSNSNYCC